jgi:hypothetical protein
MVNNDQIGIHLVPTIRKQLYKTIKVLEMEDMTQIALVVSSIIDGLPLDSTNVSIRTSTIVLRSHLIVYGILLLHQYNCFLNIALHAFFKP